LLVTAIQHLPYRGVDFSEKDDSFFGPQSSNNYTQCLVTN